MSVIDDKYGSLGAASSSLGALKSDETKTPDGIGLFRHYERGSIYWSQTTGAHEVHGDIREKWQSLGWEQSVLGYPTTDETATPDGIGRYNHFQGGSIYWSPTTGAHEVHGDIREKWQSLGWEQSFLGYPTTDQTPTPDGIGHFNHFQRGSIYWAGPIIRTREVHGTIHAAWQGSGWEQGPLGYPMTDEMSCEFLDPRDRFQVFQHGRIYWNDATDEAFIFEGLTRLYPPDYISYPDASLGTGTCFPKVKIWRDAAVGTFIPPGDPDEPAGSRFHISIWRDRFNSSVGTGGENWSAVWPLPANVGGMPAVHFGTHLDTVGGDRHKTLPLSPLDLWDTPFTIFAVVQRDSDRGDNYFLTCDGLNPTAFGVQDNSALHLGWQGNRTIRFGQYGNDLDIPDVPAFNPSHPVRSLITVISGRSGKFVSLDEPGFASSRENTDGHLLRPGGRFVNIGGSRYYDFSDVPPVYWFSGFIFELIICGTDLPDFIFQRMKNSLKTKYGI